MRDQMTIFGGVEEEAEAPVGATENGASRPTLSELLYRPVEGLPISVRAFNGLQNADIKYIGELVQRTEQDMLKIKNFGRKSLNEIKEVLTDMGLSLGMRLENLPPRGELDRMWEEQERRGAGPPRRGGAALAHAYAPATLLQPCAPARALHPHAPVA